mgnify:CR=1 FL=1
MIKILITGASGYIGSSLYFHLKRKYKILAIDKNKNSFFKIKLCNLLNQKKIEKLLKAFKPNTIVHLAGQSLVDETISRKKYYDNNCKATKNLIHAMKKNNINNIIYSSTAAVYKYKNTKLKENDVLIPKSTYAKSKLFSEKIITKSSAILLKTIEEPPPKTIFILISNDPNKLLSTIKSRLQEKKMTTIDSCILLDYFKKKFPELNESIIKEFVRKGESNYHNTFGLLIKPVEDGEVFNNFVEWIRLCFLSTNKKSKYEGDFAIIKLIDHCAMMASLEKANQLSFISATTQVFRRAFLLNYEPSFVAEPAIKHPNFSLDSFSKYVNNYNVREIFSLLSNTHYYLRRYSNSKILFLDLSFRLGKLLHKKP